MSIMFNLLALLVENLDNWASTNVLDIWEQIIDKDSEVFINYKIFDNVTVEQIIEILDTFFQEDHNLRNLILKILVTYNKQKRII